MDLTCVQLAVKFSTAKVSTAIVPHNLFLKTTFDVIGYFVARMPRRPGRERRGDPCLTNESTRFHRPIARRIERIGFLFQANEFTGQNGRNDVTIVEDFPILLVEFLRKESNTMLILSVIKVTLTKYYALHLRLWPFIINIHIDMILNNTYEYDFEKLPHLCPI